MNSNLSLLDNIEKVSKTINELEEVAGKGLIIPFNNVNSAPRKNMSSSQFDQAVPLYSAEIPYVQTSYENAFGDYSASIIEADNDMEVISVIPKFTNIPNQIYYVIMKDDVTKTIKVVERSVTEHTTETYGYIYNNSYLDSLSVGSRISKGTVIRKSSSFDEYNNRMDGVNLRSIYLATDKTMEDGIQISESAAKKLSSPLPKKVVLMFNENDLPLNLYGDDTIYKSFPDIGEDISQGILCAIRREKKEQSLFSQSYERLKDILMSDDKFTIEGTVIDIDIYSNNPEILDNFYNSQLKYYYENKIRFNSEIYLLEQTLKKNYPDYKLDYNLEKIIYLANRVVNGDQYIRDGKVFSNTILEITVLEYNKIEVGDKLADRYGGKGVISEIVPDELMVRTQDGTIIDCIFNQSTCVNRENPGQLYETSINHISENIVKFIATGTLSVEESLDIIFKFLEVVSPQEYYEMGKYLSKLNSTMKEVFLNSIITEGIVVVSVKPISNNMNMAKLEYLYDLFPWIGLEYIKCPIIGSDGNIRYPNSRRKLIAAYKYVYRLKQYAEEKFSTTSLSSTNIKGQNVKSKANKHHRSPYANTPVMFGHMETTDMQHIGIEYVVSNLLIHSVSPRARRLAEEMLTGDPFDINIKLDSKSSNRDVEILNAFLKTKGIRIKFSKVPRKVVNMISMNTTNMISINTTDMITILNENPNILNNARKVNMISIID